MDPVLACGLLFLADTIRVASTQQIELTGSTFTADGFQGADWPFVAHSPVTRRRQDEMATRFWGTPARGSDVDPRVYLGDDWVEVARASVENRGPVWNIR